MCIYAYEKISDQTKKRMIFCRLLGIGGSLAQLCISQRYCPEKDRYIEINQKKDCKNYK